MKRILLLLLALIAIPSAANAQAKVISTCGTIPASFATLVAGAQSGYWMDTNGNLCVNASVTATVTGFAPGGAFANLTATGSSADVALPAGAVVAAQNTGTTAVSCNLTVGAGSASASQNIIQPGSTVYFTVGSNTHGSCIDQTGSASNVVVFSGGAGLGTGFGGGGGSGGGLAVTDNTAFTYSSSQLTPIGGVYNSSITAVTNGYQGAFAMNANRALYIDVLSGSTMYNLINSGTTTTGSAVPASALYWGVNVGGNLVGFAPGTTGTPSTQVISVQGTSKGGLPVVNGGSFYLAVAASQTATVLQSSTGAAGDYLSHCVIYPTSTSPGVVTVFDSTNTAANSAILFPGGASSLSNLAPIPIPVGAVSVNGAWKVTTGTGVSVVCYGKFS